MSVQVRPVSAADAVGLAHLLNAIIERGGTTALDEPFSPERLDEVYLRGLGVFACVVAVAADSGQLAGFQTLVRNRDLPEGWGDVATFARVGRTRRGVGSALFAVTRDSAARLRLAAINATIRADNTGGLAYYSRMGFVDHGRDLAVPLADGTPVDRIHKRYVLQTDSTGEAASSTSTEASD